MDCPQIWLSQHQTIKPTDLSVGESIIGVLFQKRLQQVEGTAEFFVLEKLIKLFLDLAECTFILPNILNYQPIFSKNEGGGHEERCNQTRQYLHWFRAFGLNGVNLRQWR